MGEKKRSTLSEARGGREKGKGGSEGKKGEDGKRERRKEKKRRTGRRGRAGACAHDHHTDARTRGTQTETKDPTFTFRQTSRYHTTVLEGENIDEGRQRGTHHPEGGKRFNSNLMETTNANLWHNGPCAGREAFKCEPHESH